MKYQLNEPKMFSDITEGTAIVINSVTGIYYGMNPFGTAIYENLLSGVSTEEIGKAVSAIPGAPAETDKIIGSFIDTLTGFEILVPAEGESSGQVTIDPVTAGSDAFIPECKEFKDVQELLFADPIHEVDADEGWRPEK